MSIESIAIIAKVTYLLFWAMFLCIAVSSENQKRSVVSDIAATIVSAGWPVFLICKVVKWLSDKLATLSK